MYVIAAFRSRNQTLMFANILSSYGIRTAVINTPRAVMVSCGISVKFDHINLTKAREVLDRRKLDTFAGFFEISGSYQGLNIRKIG